MMLFIIIYNKVFLVSNAEVRVCFFNEAGTDDNYRELSCLLLTLQNEAKENIQGSISHFIQSFVSLLLLQMSLKPLKPVTNKCKKDKPDCWW